MPSNPREICVRAADVKPGDRLSVSGRRIVRVHTMHSGEVVIELESSERIPMPATTPVYVIRDRWTHR